MMPDSNSTPVFSGYKGHIFYPISIACCCIVSVCFLMYGVSEILLPFVVGIIAAYFLDPAADALERKGISRTKSTAAICGAFFGVLTLTTIFLVPKLVIQGADVVERLPTIIDTVKQEIMPQVQRISEKLDEAGGADDSIDKAQNYIFSMAPKLIRSLFMSGIAVLNIVALVFITPVVTFYMLRDWDRIVSHAAGLLPPRYRNDVIECMQDIDDILSGYLRGQTNVCVILGIFYALTLWIAGLEYGLFIGMLTGLLCFLPYVGIAIGATIGILLAYMQFSGDLVHVGIVAGIFLFGQFAEGNFITPKLVGDKVKLHPAWIIFALLAGGSLFGFTGVLLAVPVAAVTGVLIRRLRHAYCNSAFFGAGDVDDITCCNASSE